MRSTQRTAVPFAFKFNLGAMLRESARKWITF